MSKVKFIKWHPSVKEVPAPHTFEWDKEQIFDKDEDWLNAIDWLVTFGYYVGVHFDPTENLITIAVDNTWFRTR